MDRGAGTIERITRRAFIPAGIAGAGAAAVAARADWIDGRGWVSKLGFVRPEQEVAEEGRLLSRPGSPRVEGRVGLQSLGLAARRDALLYVPAGYRDDRPAPMVVALHGAGGNAESGMGLLRGLADALGVIVLAPPSRRQTWDAIVGRFGPDVAFLDRALEYVFDRYRVDPGRLTVGGFSDGASYALSIGLTNGDLFRRVIAFSPGFMSPGRLQGRPRLFISHGTHDDVLAIGPCSRRIVPQVRRAGYDVTYREFDGPHTVPPEIAREAVDWMLS